MPVSGGGDYGKNYAHNPKPVSATYVGLFGGATAPFSTARSFSGTGSLFATLPAAASVRWSAATDDDADLTPLSGQISAGVRASGASLSGLVARSVLVYSDGTTTVGNYQPLVDEPQFFSANVFPALTKNPSKTLRNVRVDVNNPTASSITAYLGGLDIRVDDEIDSFIHGDGPVNYSWLGTPNDSPSVRSAIAGVIVRGGGGSFRPTVNVSVVNRQKQFIRDVTGNFLDGTVTYDLDADTNKGSCSISLDDPGLIDPFADQYFDVNVDIEYADGTTEDFPVGMFMADIPQERWNAGNDSWTYPGRDMLSLLDTTVLRDAPVPGAHASEGPELIFSFAMPKNEAMASVINRLITIYTDLLPSQFALPIPGVSAIDKVWTGNATALQALTEILQSVGWRKPWVTPAGIITSAPAGDDPYLFTPAATFSTGNDSIVRWPFEVDTDGSGVGNRVRVVSSNMITDPNNRETNPAYTAWQNYKKPKKKKGNGKKKKKKAPQRGPQPPATLDKDDIITYTNIVVVRSNLDPTSPISYPTLKRWIDLPDIVKPVLSWSTYSVNNTSLGTAEAARLGDQALRDASMLSVKARLTTEIHNRGLNEVYDLDLYDINDDPFPSGQGKYFCRGWQFQLGPPWQMVHNLSRIISFETAGFN